METAVVLGRGWRPLYYHAPHGRTGGSLPDSHVLWSFLWEHRADIVGVAHSHPGGGVPSPSGTDVTTFSAIERGLGVRLVWPIATTDFVAAFAWKGPGPLVYAPWPLTREMKALWVEDLLRLST